MLQGETKERNGRRRTGAGEANRSNYAPYNRISPCPDEPRASSIVTSATKSRHMRVEPTPRRPVCAITSSISCFGQALANGLVQRSNTDTFRCFTSYLSELVITRSLLDQSYRNFYQYFYTHFIAF